MLMPRRSYSKGCLTLTAGNNGKDKVFMQLGQDKLTHRASRNFTTESNAS